MQVQDVKLYQTQPQKATYSNTCLFFRILTPIILIQTWANAHTMELSL